MGGVMNIIDKLLFDTEAEIAMKEKGQYNG